MTNSSKPTPEDLTQLPFGWDGYKGRPVSLANCNLANRINEALESVLHESPQFVPGAGGEIQIEYHNAKYLVEIFITERTQDES